MLGMEQLSRPAFELTFLTAFGSKLQTSRYNFLLNQPLFPFVTAAEGILSPLIYGKLYEATQYDSLCLVLPTLRFYIELEEICEIFVNAQQQINLALIQTLQSVSELSCFYFRVNLLMMELRPTLIFAVIDVL